MTQEEEYHLLAQQVRKAARAQLQQIRRAMVSKGLQPIAPRLATVDDPQGRVLGTGLRRKQAFAHRPPVPKNGPARMQAAIEAGLIELWDQDVPVVSQVRDTAFAEVVAPKDDGSVGEYFGPHWDADGAVMQPDTEPAGLMTEDPVPPPEAFFGPPAPVHPAAEGTLFVGAHDDRDDFALFGLSAALRASQDRPRALTLSAGMRVPSDTEVAEVDPLEPAIAVAPEAPVAPEEASSAGAWPEDAAQSALPDTASGPMAALPEADADADAAVPLPEVAASGGDLGLLPGAGPGLIWMLQKCGITSLEDMAEADVAVLMPKLGLVGQIVNLKGWVRFAQRHVGLTHGTRKAG